VGGYARHKVDGKERERQRERKEGYRQICERGTERENTKHISRYVRSKVDDKKKREREVGRYGM
jgi:hypothetical protein